MQHSNQKLTLGLSALVLSAVAAVGCMKPRTYSPNDPGLGDASFNIEKVELTENANKEKKSEVIGQLEGFSIPSQKRFNLKACLKTNKVEHPAAFAPFMMTGLTLEGKERLPIMVITDKAGCFTWTEEISYNFLGEEVYVPLTRVLTAQEGSGQRGTREIHLALNPWNLSGASSEVLDLAQKDAVPEGIKVMPAKDAVLYLNGKPEASSKQLSVIGFSLTSHPGPKMRTEQKTRVLRLTIQPSIRGLDALKKPVEFALSQASLELDAVLVAVVPGDDGSERKFRVWSSETPISFRSTDRGYSALVGFSFSPVEEENARYELMARVKTSPVLEGLKPFEVVFTLGSHAQLMSSHVLPEKIQTSNSADPTFSLNESLTLLEAAPVTPVVPPSKGEVPRPEDSAPTTDR